jgi:hypothetical protein
VASFGEVRLSSKSRLLAVQEVLVAKRLDQYSGRAAERSRRKKPQVPKKEARSNIENHSRTVQ